MSDAVENRIIEAKSRGIYEAPGMALLYAAYERLVNAIHNEDTIDSYRNEGRQLGRLLYEGRWLDPQALMLREASSVRSRRRGPARSRSTAAGRGLLGPGHLRTRALLPSGKADHGAGEDAEFGPVDRIGQLSMRNLDIADSRAKLEHYSGLGMFGGQQALIGALPAGGAAANNARGEVPGAPRREVAG